MRLHLMLAAVALGQDPTSLDTLEDQISELSRGPRYP